MVIVEKVNLLIHFIIKEVKAVNEQDFLIVVQDCKVEVVLEGTRKVMQIEVAEEISMKDLVRYVVVVIEVDLSIGKVFVVNLFDFRVDCTVVDSAPNVNVAVVVSIAKDVEKQVSEVVLQTKRETNLTIKVDQIRGDKSG